MESYAKLCEQTLNLLFPKENPPVVQQTTISTDFSHPGGMRVGITAFGLPRTFNLVAGVSEFKSFIDNNSKVKLDLRFVQTESLPTGEIPRYNAPGVCYMVTPQSLSPNSRSKMPSGMKAEIVVYDAQNLTSCFGGLQWSYTVPFICIPYTTSMSWDYGWQTPLGPGLVHEFTHALYTILGAKGFRGLPNIDRANDYGYTDQNDPGWLNFRRHCLDLITQDMADVLMKA